MKNKLIYIGAGVFLILLLVFSLFEFRYVPDVDSSEHYLPDEKTPFGAWMFYSLLESMYGADNVIDFDEIDSLSALPDDKRYLYVRLDSYAWYDEQASEDLLSFLEKGNKGIIVSDNVDLVTDDISMYVEYLSLDDKSVTVSYPSLDTARFYTFEMDTILRGPFVYYGISYHDTEYYAEVDSLVAERDSAYYGYSIGKEVQFHDICRGWHIGDGQLNVHLVPEMFSNLASQQDFYLDHFNLIIGQKGYDAVIYDHSVYRDDYTTESTSPLQFILAHPSLKGGYYLLLMGGFLYVVFRGKRKERVIPIQPPLKNTSVEYAETLGRLYFNQDKPKKLLSHISDIFYHDIKSRYYLDQSDEEFEVRLAKKSGILLDEIRKITTVLKKGENRYSFSDVDLANLYTLIQNFHNQSK